MLFCDPNEFIGYPPEFATETGSEFRFVDESLPTLAHINDFIAAVVTRPRSNGTDKVGGHRDEHFHDTFASFLPKACDEMVGTIRMFTQIWCPT